MCVAAVGAHARVRRSGALQGEPLRRSRRRDYRCRGADACCAGDVESRLRAAPEEASEASEHAVSSCGECDDRGCDDHGQSAGEPSK